MKFYVIYSLDQNEYWSGKQYVHQGEAYPCFEREVIKAKSWTSKKRAETALSKMGSWVRTYGFEIEEHTISADVFDGSK